MSKKKTAKKVSKKEVNKSKVVEVAPVKKSVASVADGVVVVRAVDDEPELVKEVPAVVKPTLKDGVLIMDPSEE